MEPTKQRQYLTKPQNFADVSRGNPKALHFFTRIDRRLLDREKRYTLGPV